MTISSISVCILFANKVEQTIDCVTSFVESGCSIVVLNNGSSNDSIISFEERISGYPQIRLINSKTNIGVSAGRNLLINETKEDWLLFVDNDITINTFDWLSRFCDHVESKPDVEVFVPKLFNNHDGCYAEFKSINILNSNAFLTTPESSYINLYPGGAAFVKRSLFVRLGNYDERIFIGLEDLEISLRALLINAPVRALLISDIELIHNHLIIYSTVNEVKSALERYNRNTIQKSCEVIKIKHGINYCGWESWVDNQIIAIKKINNYEDESNYIFAISNNRRIALIADKNDWAFHNIATHIKSSLSDKYTFDIYYTDDYGGDYDKILSDIYNNRYDLVHFYWREVILNLYFNIVKTKLDHLVDVRESFIDTKLTFSIHDHCLLDSNNLLNYKIVFNYLSDSYIVSSERLFNIYRKLIDYHDPYRVIEDGVDLAKFYPKNSKRLLDNDRKILVGWAGNSTWGKDVSAEDYKGFHTIIKPAVNELKQEGFNIDGIYADRNIKHIPHNEMNDYYNSIDIYICASSIEGTPNPILEAFACGVPVVSTDVGVVPQLFGAEQKQFILNVRSKDELKDKLRVLICNPELRMKLSEENISRISGWTRDDEANKWDDFFSHILAGENSSKKLVKRACLEVPYNYGIEATIDHFLKSSFSWRLTRPLRLLNWYALRFKNRIVTKYLR